MSQHSSECHSALHQITVCYICVVFYFHWFLREPSLSPSTALLKGKKLELHIPCAHQPREQIIGCTSTWLPTEQGEQSQPSARQGIRGESSSLEPWSTCLVS